MARNAGIRSSYVKPDQVTYMIYGKDKGRACVFAIGSKIKKDMRWISGDRVDILFDDQMAEGQIIRCREGGWQIEIGDNDNIPARVRIGYRPEFGLPLVDGPVDLAVEITDSTIVFAFPIRYRKTALTVGKEVAK